MRLPHRHLLVATLFVAPLALGSFHPWAISVLCAVAGLGMILHAIQGSRSRIRPGILGIVLALLLLYTCLQLVPLPPSVALSLWPSGAGIWDEALALVGEGDRWHPLTLEPAAGALEAAKLALLLSVVVACGLWVRTSGPRPLLTCLALVGAACGIVALAHRLSGIETAYGLYQPQDVVGDWLSAPLLNSNHLAGLMALCAPIAVGLALEEQETARRLLWTFAGAVMGMTALLTLSRGGTAALILGGGTLVLLVLRRSREDENNPHWGWVIGGVLAVLAGGLYVVREAIFEEFLRNDATTKAALWVASLPLVRDFMPLGAGRGSFVALFPAYNTIDSQHTFTHPENIAVQFSAEWGAVGVLAWVLLVVGAIYLVAKGVKRPLLAGPVAGVVALLAHNIVDFSLEMPGIAVVFVAAIVSATAGRGFLTARLKIRPRLVLVVLSILTLAGAAAAYYYEPRQLGREEEHLRVRIDQEESAFDADAVEVAVVMHPADYLIPFRAGVWAYRTREANPLPYLNHSLLRNGRWAPAHLYTARTLAATGHDDQALLEYRLTVQNDDRLTRPVAREAIGKWTTFAKIRPLVDVEDPPLELWDTLSMLWITAERPEESMATDEALLERAPAHAPALDRATKRALIDNDLIRAQELISRMPADSVPTILLRARLEARTKSSEEAAKLLEHELRQRPDDGRLLVALGHHLEKAGEINRARRAFEEWEKTSPRKRLTTVFLARAALEERSGSDIQALEFYERAAYYGAGPRALEGVARVAEKQGDFYRAIKAYRKLGSSNEGAAEKIKQLEARISRAKLHDPLSER